MPGKKYKSIGIREKLYNRIEEEKREGESISDYIDRVIDMGIAKEKEKKGGKSMVMQPNEATGKVYEAIGALRRDIASLRDGKELVTGGELSDKDIKGIAAEMLLEIGMHIENGIVKGMKALQ